MVGGRLLPGQRIGVNAALLNALLGHLLGGPHEPLLGLAELVAEVVDFGLLLGDRHLALPKRGGDGPHVPRRTFGDILRATRSFPTGQAVLEDLIRPLGSDRLVVAPVGVPHRTGDVPGCREQQPMTGRHPADKWQKQSTSTHCCQGAIQRYAPVHHGGDQTAEPTLDPGTEDFPVTGDICGADYGPEDDHRTGYQGMQTLLGLRQRGGLQPAAYPEAVNIDRVEVAMDDSGGLQILHPAASAQAH
ncbi:hypothetical protein ETB97_003848 [Aspergillus alliaceus]|uniref:Uncharacterized protein n=1 Tax=Petromyces alliaceus TaxID=209559 RepID=A0A8H6A265_PETAA|nr:hypothetical protein ETB97_003848 [Aspergillus burnettii]